MNKLKNIVLSLSFVVLAFVASNSLEAKSAGQNLDKGIEKTKDACEDAKESAKDHYDNAVDKVTDGLEKSKSK
ncbi:MAG: hypothetical protein H0X29_03845 [Parachlamydiaceae bacterium]|nr:hypothetical protein [Parachlamydiaceae bacterium]